MDEIPLKGGNVNLGVVRVGNTVRRPAARAAVAGFLAHLEQRGFTAAPKYLGRDAKGRDVLSFLPGNTDFPDDLWTHDRALIAATVMLRAMHDASVGFDHSGDWTFTHPGPCQVICHNDFAPYNFVFNDGLPTGVIDFDLAGPGPRLRDLAYFAYWMVPLSFSGGDMTPASQADVARNHHRLRLICATYGTDDMAGLIAMTSGVLHHMRDQDACARMVGDAAAKRLKDGGHFAHWAGEAMAFDAHKDGILKCLN